MSENSTLAPYYLCRCNFCYWIGSSEQAHSIKYEDDEDGPLCPKCWANGHHNSCEHCTEEEELSYIQGKRDGYAIGLSEGLSLLRAAMQRNEWTTFYHASTNYTRQERTSSCMFCAGEFISAYPDWIEPTDTTFPHKQNCKWRLLLDSTPPQTEGAVSEIDKEDN